MVFLTGHRCVLWPVSHSMDSDCGGNKAVLFSYNSLLRIFLPLFFSVLRACAPEARFPSGSTAQSAGHAAG